MSWSRGSLLAALLALPVPFALADTVIVNTTTDDNAANSLCSLREAVAYLKTVDGLALESRPASNANGCARQGDASDAHVVKLPYGSSAYRIDSVIDIDVSLAITGEETEDDTPLSPFVWVRGSQAFKLDGPDVPAEVTGQPGSQIDLLKSADALDVDADNQTSNAYPYFSGPVNGHATICLYRQQGSGEESFLRAVVPAVGATTWVERSPMPFAQGVTELIVAGTSNATCPETSGDATVVDTLKINVYAANIVSMSLVDIVGCGASPANLPAHIVDAGVTPAACAAAAGSKGGIFYNNESLTLEAMAIRGGGAEKGGIAYVGEDGVLTVGASALVQATATEGAAIYLERSSLQLTNSLVAGNTAAEAIKFGSGELLNGITRSLIQNSTFHDNSGFALNLNENVRVNSVTLVENAGGAINFSGDATAMGDNVQVFNSIVAGACQSAPTWAATNLPVFNVADGSCGFTAASNMPAPAVLVAAVNPDGTCAATGRLCPKDPDGDGLADFYLPRYFPDDKSFTTDAADADIIIINRGSNEAASSCAAQDQRNSDRSKAGRCDVGAVEFQFNGGLLSSGGKIVAGAYAQSFAPDLGDEELFLPVAGCPDTLSTIPTADGCPWLSVAPGKGTVRLTADRKGYVYQPRTDFHGFDTFRIELTTTASRLNEPSHPTGTTRTLGVTVTNEPASGLTSSGLLGGSMDWLALLGLGGLLAQRRIRKGGIRA